MPQICDFAIPSDTGTTIFASSISPAEPHACLTLAPHSGSGMNRPFMVDISQRLADRGIATVRFDFPFMRSFSRRPDSAVVLDRVMRTVMNRIADMFPAAAHFMGGSSFGARVSAAVQARAPIDGVQGMVFMGFPLHPVNRPSTDNAKPLRKIRRPMLFLQGIGDEAADADMLDDTVRSLGRDARLQWIAGSDGALRSVTRREAHHEETGAADTARHIADWIERYSSAASESSAPPGSRSDKLQQLEQSIGRMVRLVEVQRERVGVRLRAGLNEGVAGDLLATWCRSLDLLRWQRDLLVATIHGTAGQDARPAQPRPGEFDQPAELDIDLGQWQRDGLHEAHSPLDVHPAHAARRPAPDPQRRMV